MDRPSESARGLLRFGPLADWVLVSCLLLASPSCSPPAPPPSSPSPSPAPSPSIPPLTLTTTWLPASHQGDVVFLRLPMAIEDRIVDRAPNTNRRTASTPARSACWRIDDALLGDVWRQSAVREWRVIQLDGTSRVVTTEAAVLCENDHGASPVYLVSSDATWAENGRLAVPEGEGFSIAIADVDRAPVPRVPGPFEMDEVFRASLLEALRSVTIDVGAFEARGEMVMAGRNGADHEAVLVAFSSGGEWETAIRVFAIAERGDDGRALLAHVEGPTCHSCPVSLNSDDFAPSLIAAADLDGDGEDELIVRALYYEGEGTRVYRWHRGRYWLAEKRSYLGE